ncbi:hypothetical protein F4Z99_17470 [Candidatus Poribacteria bacterium]|nr:hypothetical protein [Candidatus Poribacteria bacterium]
MNITLGQLYNFTIGVKVFQLVPQWIEKSKIKEIFEAVTDCMNVVNEMEAQIKFDYSDEDIKAFTNLVAKFKTVRDRHKISIEVGLTDSAVRIGIGEHITGKIANKEYRHFYEYLRIIEEPF